MTIKGQRSEKNQQGKSYLNIKKIKVKMTVGDAKGRLEDTSKNQRNEAFSEFIKHHRYFIIILAVRVNLLRVKIETRIKGLVCNGAHENEK